MPLLIAALSYTEDANENVGDARISNICNGFSY